MAYTLWNNKGFCHIFFLELSMPQCPSLFFDHTAKQAIILTLAVFMFAPSSFLCDQNCIGFFCFVALLCTSYVHCAVQSLYVTSFAAYATGFALNLHFINVIFAEYIQNYVTRRLLQQKNTVSIHCAPFLINHYLNV